MLANLLNRNSGLGGYNELGDFVFFLAGILQAILGFFFPGVNIAQTPQ